MAALFFGFSFSFFFLVKKTYFGIRLVFTQYRAI